MTPTTIFTQARTDAVLVAACHIVGLDPRDARLLRFGENAIYGLPREHKVVRIGRSLVAAAKEVHVAGWLAGHGFPSVRLTEGFAAGPLVLDDLPVTVWQQIDESDLSVTPAEFGRALRSLHALPAPADFRLPDFQAMPKVPNRLESLAKTDIPRDDLAFLRHRFEEVSADFEDISFELPPGPIHGDAHPGNLMRARTGEVLLIDFEDFVYGPREWDAAVLSVRYQAFGWESEDDYRAYVEAYGFEPIGWDGFVTLRAARELNMTTWLSQRYGESRTVDAEIHKRIADLRDDQALRHWSVF